MKIPHKVAILALFTVIAYLPAMRGPFVFDDDWVLRDCRVTGGCPIPLFHDTRSLQHLSERVIYRFWPHNTLPFHLFGLSIHILNGLLFFWIARNLFSLSEMTTLLALGLFWLHPMNSQAVIYIAEVCEPLCLFGILLSFIGFSTGRHVLSISGLLIGLMSKEIGLMIPALWLVWLVYRGEVAKHRVKLLVCALFACLMFATHQVQVALPYVMQNASLGHLPNVLFLLSKFILPMNLTIDHDLRFLVPLTTAAVVITALLALLAIAYRKTIAGFGLMWIAVLALPHLLAEAPGYLAEHHFYSPSIGIFLMMAVFIGKVIEHGSTPISTAVVECK